MTNIGQLAEWSKALNQGYLRLHCCGSIPFGWIKLDAPRCTRPVPIGITAQSLHNFDPKLQNFNWRTGEMI